jgi:hypothetical protein
VAKDPQYQTCTPKDAKGTATGPVTVRVECQPNMATVTVTVVNLNGHLVLNSYLFLVILMIGIESNIKQQKK